MDLNKKGYLGDQSALIDSLIELNKNSVQADIESILSKVKRLSVEQWLMQDTDGDVFFKILLIKIMDWPYNWLITVADNVIYNIMAENEDYFEKTDNDGLSLRYFISLAQICIAVINPDLVKHVELISGDDLWYYILTYLGGDSDNSCHEKSYLDFLIKVINSMSEREWSFFEKHIYKTTQDNIIGFLVILLEQDVTHGRLSDMFVNNLWQLLMALDDDLNNENLTNNIINYITQMPDSVWIQFHRMLEYYESGDSQAFAKLRAFGRVNQCGEIYKDILVPIADKYEIFFNYEITEKKILSQASSGYNVNRSSIFTSEENQPDKQAKLAA